MKNPSSYFHGPKGPLSHQHVKQWEVWPHLKHQVCSLIEHKKGPWNPFPQNAAHVGGRSLLYRSTLKLSSPSLHDLLFLFRWGQNVSNGQMALPETVKFCQTKKIKARPCHKNTAYGSAGCTSETRLVHSCTPSWHFNVGQMLIRSITDSEISQATSASADTADCFWVSGVCQPPVWIADHKTWDNEPQLAPEEKVQSSDFVFSCFFFFFWSLGKNRNSLVHLSSCFSIFVGERVYSF